MGDTAVVDRLSLTLPRWDAKVKFRIKRPKRPSVWRMVVMAIIVVNCLNAVIAFVMGEPARGVLYTAKAVVWSLYREAERRGEHEGLALAAVGGILIVQAIMDA